VPVLLEEQIIEFEAEDLANRQPLTRPVRPLVRAPGAHVSDIIKYIAIEISGWLKKGERDEEEFGLLMAMGIAWEEFVFSLLPDALWQPGERIRDQIAGNADGIGPRLRLNESLFDPRNPVSRWVSLVEETKLTTKCVFDGEEIFHHNLYMHQGRAYCNLYDTDIVRWRVNHIRGDYGKLGLPWGPIYKIYTVQFSEQEINMTWRMLMKHRDAAMEWKKGGI
jgi:hypothetical protein